MEFSEIRKRVILEWITMFILFNCVKGKPTLVEGDIHFEESSSIRTMAMPILIGTKSWSNGKVPYILDHSIPRDKVEVIKQAMKTIESRTDFCVDFIQVQNSPEYFNKNPDFINITAQTPECYSSVGRKTGGQDLNLGPGCFTETIILHELLHALGFWHEHSRTDRDDYIVILYKNILEGEATNFEKRPDSTGVEQAVDYDFFSLLHYKSNQFSKSQYHNTIIPNAKYIGNIKPEQLGQGKTLSKLDVKRIKWLYNCKEEASESIQLQISLKSFCPLPDFAFVEVSPKKSKYNIDDTVKFTCSDVIQGRTLIGGNESTCLSDGSWSGAKPFCIKSSSIFLYCDMEDSCVSNQYASTFMQINWQKHPDRPARIGPGKDHTTETVAGRYLYIGADDRVGYKAYLLSPSFKSRGRTKLCLMFYYNMYSDNKRSTLRVIIRGSTVWTNSTSTGTKEWVKAKIRYGTPSYPTSFRVLFIAEKGTPNAEATVAIDDVFMAPCTDIEAYEKVIDQTENKPREYD